MQYDLLIKNGYVVDYASAREGYFDVAVQNGMIAAVESSIGGSAVQELDASGKLVLPGLVDSHVHASAWLGGSYAHTMLVKAGVTSALDMSGQGSLGIKLLGGHYPLTVAATARAIRAAAELGAYTAFHAGTAAHGSNIEGLLEAVELADGNPLHLAHINAYCRGTVLPEAEETELALKALAANPNISCESYLSPLNGTSAEIIDGLPGSMVTRRCLKTGGFTEDEAGMEEAFLSGWAQVNYPQGQEMTLLTGEAARDYWRGQQTLVSVSFAVNPVGPRVRLATAKKADGSFAVDAVSTDGGGIPRNVLLPAGLALVDLGGLSLQELVAKISYQPALQIRAA